MSTVSSRTGRRRLPLVGRSESAGSRSTPQRRRWISVAVTAALLVGLVWLAPLIVAATPLFDSVLRSLTADLQGEVRVQSASLGWFSPVVLTDVEARGADGEPLAKIPSASTRRTLLHLVTGGGDPGLRLQQPIITLTLDDEGSNLERFLQKVLAKADPTEATPFSLAVSDGQVTVVDRAARREWTVEEFMLELDSPGNEARPLKLAASGVVHDRGQRAPFKLETSLANDAFSGSGQTSKGTVKLQGQQLPLELFAHAWRRASGDPRAALAGQLTADLDARWSFGNVGLKTLSARGQFAVDQLQVAGAPLGDRPLQFASLDLPFELSVKDGALDVGRLDLTCDWGHVQATGRLADWQSWSAGALGWQNLAPLARSEGEVAADIDIAALARVMPGVIRLRDGTEITAGRLQARLSSHAAQPGWAWDANLLTSRIEATHQGRRIAWEKPIQIQFAAADAGQGLVVKKLLADSEFLQIQGEGNLDYLSVSATYELDRLAQELSQFVDLRDWRLAGEGWTYATWERKPDDAFVADAEIQVRNLKLAAPGGPVWQEENLLCNVDLAGTLQTAGVERIDKLQLKVDAQGDRGDAALTSPVAWKTLKNAWPFDVRLTGRIERWLARAALLTSQAAQWKAQGDAQLACRLDYAGGTIDVPKFDLKASNFQLEQFGFLINEPTLEMTGSGSFSGEPLRWELREMQMRTSSLDARARDVVGRYAHDGTPEITGNVDFAVDLARWRNAWRGLGEPSPWQLSGQLQGQARITDRDGTLAADLNAVVRQLAARYGQGPVVTDPELRVAARGGFDRRNELLKLDRATIESQALQADISGTLRNPASDRVIDLSGKVDYDLEKLQGLLAPYLGESVAITGRSSRDFKLSGPLGSATGRQFEQLHGEASVAWDALTSYGFVGGPGVLAAKVSAGKVAITPLDFTVNDGRCRLSPTLTLTPAPGEVRLPREQVLDHVRVTPEMCAQALAYVAPVLAGVGQADGKFSVALDGARLPLDDPRQGDVSGTLTVHDVRVSAGPLVQVLAVVLNRATEASLTKEAEVPFRMVQGRVYHKDLELVFPELTVRTHGSVGFDRSLAILAEMPVPPKWIGTNTLGTALQNQTIRLPIGGTLDQPVIDRRELDRLAAQFIQDAAGNLLQQELGKQLDRLLGPPK